MALSDPQTYTGDGATRDFTILGEIPSESHLRVWLDDVLISSDSWDLLGNTVLLDDAPEADVTIQFLVSTTGTDFPQNPTNISNVATNINKITNVSDNMSLISDVDTDMGSIQAVEAELTAVTNIDVNMSAITNVNTNIGIVTNVNTNMPIIDNVNTNMSIVDNVNTNMGIVENVNTNMPIIDNVNTNMSTLQTVSADTVALNNINNNLAEILLADDNATIAITKASEASTSATASALSETNAAISEAAALDYANSINPTQINEDLASLKSSTVAKVASSVLLNKDSLALDNSVITKSNANVTYTGNGTTQDIVTGISSVDFTVASNGSGYYHDRVAGDCVVKNDAGTIIESGSCVVNTSKVHGKARTSTYSNSISDGLRGIDRTIFTNLTAIESTSSGRVTSFNSNGITLGSDTQYNASGITYILHQTLYTHIKWGLTSQGKRYLTAYNPVTREVMTIYQGSGLAGHQIPNPLGIKLDYIEVKNLDGVTDWLAQYQTNNYLHLNLTNIEVSSTNVISQFSDDYNTLGATGTLNSSNNTYISYGFANSETKIITQYQGTGASGNFVETKDVNGVAKKPRRAIIKRTDSVGSWVVIDSERPATSTTFLDLPNSELSYTNIEFLNSGFNTTFYGASDAASNISGGQYIAIVEFDTTSSNDDTYFDLPTDDTNLTLVNGKLVFTDGRATNGGYNVSTQDFTGSIDFTGISDGIKYVGLDEVGNVVAYDDIPLFNSETGIMYANDEVTPLASPICFIDDKPYQITSETPMDRLEDYPSIPKNIMESTSISNLTVTDGFDLGQSWVDVTSERAIGVTYTNDTGKPIMVNTWTGNVSSTGSLSIFVNGVIIIGNQHPSTNYMMSSGAVIVPNGSTYSTEKGSGEVGTLYFMELR